jgi:polysaccharide export outer membrane protein
MIDCRSDCRVALALFVALLVAMFSQPASGAAQTPIRPGDKLQITVFNHADLSGQVSVTSNGDAPVPVAGGVTVEGLTQTSAARRIESALAPFMNQPAVQVRIIQQGQSIFFTGLMMGVQGYQPGETLGSAVAAFTTGQTQAGGSDHAIAAQGVARTEAVDLRRVRIERGTKPTAPVDLEALARQGDPGPRLQPGDVVMLAAKPVRVDVRGDIAAPVTVYLYNGETLNQAVNEAGGFRSTTSLAGVVLNRDGTDRIVSAAGPDFIGAAHNGDVLTLRPAPRVSVLGSVEKPGDTTLQVGSTLMSALYEAGGPNKYADLKHIKVVHGGTQTIRDVARLTHGDLSQDVAISDGDVIYVPEGHKIDPNGIFSAIGALASLKFLGF